MARYKRKRPLGEVEAILYTGDNTEEVKEFLGANYLGLAVEKGENREIYFEQNVDYISTEIARPLLDMVVKNSNGDFKSIDKNFFQEKWEEME